MKKGFKTILLDCDGVVLDSNKIKTEAFKKTLENEPNELVEEFINYHTAHQGIDRFRKIHYYLKEIKKLKNNYDQMYNDYIKIYSNLCQANLLKANLVPGVLNFLKSLKKIKFINVFIISGSDQEELRYIFNEKKISSYFHGIYGSPLSKKEIIQKLIDDKKIITPTIFFGDAKSDMEAAETYNFKFVYISGFSDWIDGEKICKQKKINVLENFNLAHEIIDHF